MLTNKLIADSGQPNQGLQNLDFSQKRRLTVGFNQANLTIYIHKSFVPPVSWFVTDENGNISTSGQIQDYSYTIDLSDLPAGVYYLRIAGEVHIIKNLIRL